MRTAAVVMALLVGCQRDDVAALESRWESARLHDNQYDVNSRRRWFCVWGPDRTGGECFRDDRDCREAAVPLEVGCIESYVAWCPRTTNPWPSSGCFLSKRECGDGCGAVPIDDCFLEKSTDPRCLREP